jgi:cytochrome c oxidase assembly protein subunit 11
VADAPATQPRRQGLLVLKLAGICAGMFAFGFAMAPLYNAFCAVTGYGGKTANVAENVVTDVDQHRTVRIEFLASVAAGGRWEFHPEVTHMDVHPGKLYETHYWARNLTDRHVVAQAVPSVAPGEAAEDLKKTQCFCFTQQAFAPGEGRNMPLIFMISPELPEHINEMSLAYTFFVLPDNKED